VKNQGTKLMNFRAFSIIGISAGLLALACGSNDNADNTDPGVDVVAPPPRPTCEDNEFLAGCPDPNAAPEPGGGPVATPDPAPAPGPRIDDPNELAKAAAENVLLEACGQCHGTNLSITEAKGGGFNFINDIDQLVAKGYIVPLDPENSRIIKRMRAGEMPPPNQGFSPVADSDIEVVASYIKNPNFWDLPEQDDCSKSGQVFGFDDLYAAVADDIAGEDADDQVNFRYIALTNRFTAGVCADTALDNDRQALIKMVNSLSNQTSVETLFEVNKERTIYRIDLRDYGWDRPISVNGTAFTDVWEAIAGNNAYAVQFTGDDADRAIEDAGTNFPVMLADSMLDAATIGNLYYAIIDVDVNQTIDQFILDTLQIDVVADLEDSDLVRAGTTKSRISRQDRVVERHEINARPGAFWQSFDFADDQNESIFEDPFAFNEGGREAIFTLNNGLLGFLIADDQGNLVEDSDILLDTNQNNFRAVTSVSCSGCHATGFIPVVDEVRELSLNNRIALQFDNDEVEELEDVYPTPTAFAAIVADDSENFYQRALDQLSLPTRGGDPISSTFLRFDRDMQLKDAAGDLGFTPAELLRNLRDLNPVLTVLDGGVIDRDDFTALYVDSLCILSISNENAPLADVCAAADALVNQ
jgi:mono/diheme cytochrome c family protein